MTATINAITPQCNDGTTITFLVNVTFNDATTGFSATKTYSFALGTTQAQAVATITADGNLFKTALASISNLQSKVGSVITI